MNLPLSFNARVPREMQEILAFYEEVAGSSLADSFYQELLLKVGQVQKNPNYFPFSAGDRRRANLDVFPYHFLYRITSDSIRILVLRHNHRNPNFGIRRQ